MTGPRARASPDTAAQTPKASARVSRSGYTCRMMDKVPGSLAAAPIPMIDPAGDQPIDVPRQRGHHGSAAEDGDPDEHDTLAPEDVTEHSGHQHEAGERQRVAVDHPLQRGDPRVQIALDIGQPDADDRVVQEGEEEHPAQRGERESLGGRTEPTLLDVETGRRALASERGLGSLGQQGAPPRQSEPGHIRSVLSWARVLRTQGAGSGTPNGVPPGVGGGCRRLRGAPLGRVRGLGVLG